MTVVDLAIVNVALPTIGRKLHYPRVGPGRHRVRTHLGGFLLLGGRAADLLGRGRIFMAGLALFTAASLACALATSERPDPVRGVQGLGAAMVLPAALSIVMNMFPEGAERNKALGMWGAIGASGATVGVLAGGALTRYAGWPYIFYLNVPVGGAALLLTRRMVPESGCRRTPPLRPARRRHRDRRPGRCWSTRSRAPRAAGAATRTVALLAASAALLAAFVVIETGRRRRCCRCGCSG